VISVACRIANNVDGTVNQVAIKILNHRYREVGEREAASLRLLHGCSGGSYASLIHMYLAFDFMGHVCLVLELCQGASLQSFVHRPSGEA
jgi:hypothetical protein